VARAGPAQWAGAPGRLLRGGLGPELLVAELLPTESAPERRRSR
jgi:hypothetical protein